MSIQPGKTEPKIETRRARRAPAIRLVAIDLDGTLLNSEKHVSDQTIEAMQCLPAACAS